MKGKVIKCVKHFPKLFYFKHIININFYLIIKKLILGIIGKNFFTRKKLIINNNLT